LILGDSGHQADLGSLSGAARSVNLVDPRAPSVPAKEAASALGALTEDKVGVFLLQDPRVDANRKKIRRMKMRMRICILGPGDTRH